MSMAPGSVRETRLGVVLPQTRGVAVRVRPWVAPLVECSNRAVAPLPPSREGCRRGPARDRADAATPPPAPLVAVAVPVRVALSVRRPRGRVDRTGPAADPGRDGGVSALFRRARAC